jgi:hypothetical protein
MESFVSARLDARTQAVDVPCIIGIDPIPTNLHDLSQENGGA